MERDSSVSSSESEDEAVEELNETVQILPTQTQNDRKDTVNDLDSTIHLMPTQTSYNESDFSPECDNQSDENNYSDPELPPDSDFERSYENDGEESVAKLNDHHSPNNESDSKNVQCDQSNMEISPESPVDSDSEVSHDEQVLVYQHKSESLNNDTSQLNMNENESLPEDSDDNEQNEDSRVRKDETLETAANVEDPDDNEEFEDSIVKNDETVETNAVNFEDLPEDADDPADNGEIEDRNVRNDETVETNAANFEDLPEDAEDPDDNEENEDSNVRNHETVETNAANFDNLPEDPDDNEEIEDSNVRNDATVETNAANFEDRDADDESGGSSDDDNSDNEREGVIDTNGLLASPTKFNDHSNQNEEEYDPEEPQMKSLSPADEKSENSLSNISPELAEKNEVIDHMPEDNDDTPDVHQPDEVINDIFGSSDSEGEFEGFDDIEIAEKEQEVAVDQYEKRGFEEGDEDNSISDFDKMLMKKKAEKARRRRKRHDVEIINDQDDKILNMITKMRDAADRDRELNKNNQVALEKLKLLKSVVFELKKCHLLSAFVENGVLLCIYEWLTPLPDGSLPHLQIRSSLLEILESFPSLDSAMLRESNIGRAVMLLYKHPKEIRENRIRAGKLVNKWARPIFQLTADFGSMTREDREQRDLEKMPPQKRRKHNTDKRRDEEDEDAPKGPGEKGFILRARVPMPSFKDYVVRPKSRFENLDDEDDEMPKPQRRHNATGQTRIDKYINRDRERRTKAKNTHAIKVNLCGSKT